VGDRACVDVWRRVLAPDLLPHSPVVIPTALSRLPMYIASYINVTDRIKLADCIDTRYFRDVFVMRLIGCQLLKTDTVSFPVLLWEYVKVGHDYK
jgi:hypothetical protein